MEFDRVAGGVVWREESGMARLALVHRPARGDWSLPKGKLDPGEPWHEAALREVAEETGCEARLSRFAGAKLFLARPIPKLVLYWHMDAVHLRTPRDLDEVDEVAWLSPREAFARLDHPSDRRMLLRCLSGGARRHDPRRARGDAAPLLDGSAVRKRLILDGRCANDQLAPFLRIIEKAVLTDCRRHERRPRLLRR
jgi:8-oxo-dGTP diphosphatase